MTVVCKGLNYFRCNLLWDPPTYGFKKEQGEGERNNTEEIPRLSVFNPEPDAQVITASLSENPQITLPMHEYTQPAGMGWVGRLVRIRGNF